MMSVGENVAFRTGAARHGPRRASRAQQRRCSSGWASAARRHKRVDELSGGQRQRVAIARSLVLEPTLLLLDEPLGALDLKLREHMKIELKQLQAAFGTTFVYITHDQSEALVLSDHVGVMSRGRFEQLGTPQDLYYRPQTPFVAGFVGANNRIVGRVTSARDRCLVEMTTADGWAVRALAEGGVKRGRCGGGLRSSGSGEPRAHAPRSFRPGSRCTRARSRACCSTARIRRCCCKEARTRREFRIALPQTGQFSDLKPQEKVVFSFDPERAVCFPARPGRGGRNVLARPSSPGGRAGWAWACCSRRRSFGSARSSFCRTSISRCCRFASASDRASTSRAWPSTGLSSPSRSTGMCSCAPPSCRSSPRS